MNTPKTAEVCDRAETQVTGQLKNIDRQLARFNELEEMLRVRLGAIVRDAPIEADGTKNPQETLVPLAEDLRSMSNKAKWTAERFEQMLDCIEL